jgi:hypothetical protein
MLEQPWCRPRGSASILMTMPSLRRVSPTNSHNNVPGRPVVGGKVSGITERCDWQIFRSKCRASHVDVLDARISLLRWRCTARIFAFTRSTPSAASVIPRSEFHSGPHNIQSVVTRYCVSLLLGEYRSCGSRLKSFKVNSIFESNPSSSPAAITWSWFASSLRSSTHQNVGTAWSMGAIHVQPSGMS